MVGKSLRRHYTLELIGEKWTTTSSVNMNSVVF